MLLTFGVPWSRTKPMTLPAVQRCSGRFKSSLFTPVCQVGPLFVGTRRSDSRSNNVKASIGGAGRTPSASAVPAAEVYIESRESEDAVRSKL